MDPSVALVQAYLRVNGYFTVAEYPILEATRPGGYRMATDLDLLAFRFPRAGRRVAGAPDGEAPLEYLGPDPELGAPSDEPDMLIGEVKEGRARLNPATRDPAVLRVALTRFGCCEGDRVDPAVEELLRRGRADLPRGHRIRLVTFGGRAGNPDEPADATVSLGHVVRFLCAHLRDNWDVLRHAQFKDTTLGFLATLEKAKR